MRVSVPIRRFNGRVFTMDDSASNEATNGASPGSRRTRGWWGSLCLVMGSVLSVAPNAALGQLSPADIAALKERGEAEGWTFTVGENPATGYSIDELCGLVVPKDWWVDARFDPCTPRRDLPESYNWCDLGGCTSVKNQGGCGSCWAFGTVGPLECNILIKDGIEVDLSEQWLVSCNREDWGCDGGWWAHDYHQWKGDPCGGFGAVLEEDFPYMASDLPCECPYPHEYLLDGWAYIGEPWTIPSVDSIKQAILDFGPVSVAVAVDDAFHAYNGGVFNACSGTEINHAVTLVGWDDNQGSEGVWFLRNSWSPGWGESGYMRIEYDCSLVGYNACYVAYVGTTSLQNCEINTLVASDVASDAQFGHAVAADDDENAAVVGAPQHPCVAGSQCGAAYVYRWSGGSWDHEQAQLTASDAAAYDKFGSSVTISGGVVLVGAPNDDYDGSADAGSAYLFRRNDNGTPEDPGDDFWVEEQQLTAPVVVASAQFGSAVAIEGDMALVGASGDGSGAVYVFQYGGSSWDYVQKLTALDAAEGDGFGTSLSISGDAALIGATFVDCGAGSDCGAAYVYRWSESTWDEEWKLTASDGLGTDWFGRSVSVDGNLAMVGSPLADCDLGSNCGAAYVYERTGADWIEKSKVITVDRATSNYVGWSVAIRDGVGLAGAFGLDCLKGANCGAAYFLGPTEDGWAIDGKLVPSDPGAGDSFGSSVALGKHVAMVGAKSRYYPDLAGAGAVYVYAFLEDCNGNGVADTCDILSGYSLDEDDNSRPDECICIASSQPEPERLDLPEWTPVPYPISQKVRYLSFSAGDTGTSQAVRVTFDNVPQPYDHWGGTKLWVQQPQAYCENAGAIQESPCPTAVGGLPSLDFWGATLGCEPHWDDWTQYDLVHVWNEGIIPGGAYDVQVIDSTCSTTAEGDYSMALTLTQAAWADVVKDCSTTPCGPSDGSTGIVDVTAILDKYKNLDGNVTKARADLEGSPAGDARVPDQAINITDVTFCLGAFLGEPYPPPGFPPPGNPPGCP